MTLILLFLPKNDANSIDNDTENGADSVTNDETEKLNRGSGMGDIEVVEYFLHIITFYYTGLIFYIL